MYCETLLFFLFALFLFFCLQSSLHFIRQLKFLVLFPGITISSSFRLFFLAQRWTFPTVIIVYLCSYVFSPMNCFEFSFDRTNEKSREKREDDISNARERTSEKKKESGCVYKRKDGREREHTGHLGRAQKLSSKSAPLSAPGNPREVRASAEIIEFLLLDRPLSSRRPPLGASPPLPSHSSL